jgi:hypothetical protein
MHAFTTTPHGSRMDRARRGSALVMVTLVTAVLATLSFALLTVSLAGAGEQRGAKERMRARYVAEAALSDAVLDLATGGDGNLGNAQNPVQYGSGAYWVEATPLGGDLFELVGTGREDRAGARIELTLGRTTTNLFRWAAFGDETMTMDSNARVDSYDSGAGSYAAQMVNGSGSNAYANPDGDIGSNEDVTVEANVQVWGDAFPGPSGTTTITGTATVSGSTAPMPELVVLPEILVPVIPSSGSMTVGGTMLSLPAGDYHYDAFTVNSSKSVHVTGPARIVIENFELKSGAQFIVDASGGPVKLYVMDDFILGSSTLMASTTKAPIDLQVNLLSDNIANPAITVQLDVVTLNSNAQLYGTLYAPNSLIDIDSNFELFGSVVGRRVHLDSNSRVHYDETLATAASLQEASWETVCWRVLPFRP